MRGEVGAVSAFVAIIAVAVVLVAGLVHDGGRLLTARRQADDIAGNAARVGAQELDEHRLRQGDAVVDPVAASQAVADYLATTPATGSARIAADVVSVDVEVRVAPGLLGIAGIGVQTIAATRRARAVRGVIEGDS
jgi:HD superfamily phosphodiesterase